jgi:hypothetical protein
LARLTRIRAAVAVGWLAIAGVAVGVGCGGTPPAAPKQAVQAEPRWEDVLDTTPELLAVVYPASLRSDPVYGPLLRRVIELVRERSGVVAATRALEAMEDAEQLVFAVRPDSQDGPGEVVVVVRGVRAEIDPANLVDADGKTLWGPGPTGAVRELVSADVAPSTPASRRADAPTTAASLFELPGRTWVIATGDARGRARDVFAHPIGRPAIRLETRDGPSLAFVRIDGPALVARVRALQDLGGLGAVGRRLESVTLELGGGAGLPEAGPDRDVRAVLTYGTEDAAAFAEVTIREVIDAIARKRPDDLAWLASATVDRPGKRIAVAAPLPARLIVALLHAGAAKLDLPAPDKP